MPVTLSQAARLAGKSKNTLVRAIKAGKLKAPLGEKGAYAIDEAELAKVFPPAGPSGADVLEAEVEGLRALLAEVRALLEEVKASRDDLRRERDFWREQAERLAAARGE
jgi:hypothetical protein